MMVWWSALLLRRLLLFMKTLGNVFSPDISITVPDLDVDDRRYPRFVRNRHIGVGLQSC